jgi:CHASE2 domain-containing sensor protein
MTTPSSRTPGLLRSIAVAFAVVIVLNLIKVGLEQTPLGRWAEKQTYSFLAGNLPSFAAGGPTVVVIDIGHIPGGAGVVGQAPTVTSRMALREILDALVAVEPLAIGIDVDFSPNRSGWIDKGDPAFLDHCLRLGARVPIRVGVFRGMRERPDDWLGLPKYSSLAGAIWLPEDGARRLPISVAAKAGAPELPSLGGAVATAVGRGRDLLAHPLSFMLQPVTEEERSFELHGTPVVFREALVNYGLVEQMKGEALIAATPADIRKYSDRIKNRVVFIGDLKAGPATDVFPIPGFSRDQRGVLLHTSLAGTLLAHPIAEFSHTTRVVLDLILGCVIAGVALSAHRRYGSKAAHALEARAVAITVALVIGCGIAFVIWFRVMWLDFLLVVVFLLLHPGAHAWFTKRIERFRSSEKGGAHA